MTKIPATKRIQSSPSKKALWPALASVQGSYSSHQIQDKSTRNNNKYTDREIMNFRKDLTRSRLLVQRVKTGRGYFSTLREETAMKKRQEQIQKLKEEELNKFQPAKKVSDIHLQNTLLKTYDEEKFKDLDVIIRPFTPIHSCIISPSLPEAHVEPLYRQLCALHWLLEALTIDHTHHTMRPVIACWNPKDPGGSKSPIKKINKDKPMGQRWDHFITTPKTKKFKVPAMRMTARKQSRRGSTASLIRTSGVPSPQSSMISVNPGSDEPQSVVTQATGSKDIEDNESSSTRPDDEPLHIHLQKLLEMVREDAHRTMMLRSGIQYKAPSILSVFKQNKSDSAFRVGQTTHKSSERSSMTNGENHIQVTPKKSKGHTNRDIIHYKSGICNSMRAKFYSVAQEASFCLQDKMEIFMKRQEERGLQKFYSFSRVSNFQKDMAKMRRQHVSVLKGDAEEFADHWYFDLLSKLPEDLKSFRPAKKILAKLQKFGENLDLRIRPHVLLKVLQDLRIWELCSPDISVAVEFVREHIIRMPQEDYISWLQGRVNIPIRPYTALT